MKSRGGFMFDIEVENAWLSDTEMWDSYTHAVPMEDEDYEECD
jgi:hypothetical protein